MPIQSNSRKKPFRAKGFANKSKKRGDSFFEPEPKRHRKDPGGEDIIESDDSDVEDMRPSNEGEAGSDDAEAVETAAEKRHRIAMGQLEKIRALTKKWEDGGGGAGQEDDEDDGGAAERQAKRDSLVADILQKEQLEQSGRVRRLIASRVMTPEPFEKFRIVHRHQQSVTAVALLDDDSRGFSASKDGTIVHWDVESGKKEKYTWPKKETSAPSKNNSKDSVQKQSRHVLALGVSSDGRYLATGGLDRLIHLWDTRTREHIQAFQGHKAPVSCLTFRQGTAELFSGSFDRMIKWWNAEDRCHVNNLFGHQAEVLTIDCLRKERVLSVGRDRTMRLFKVFEESSLRYSTPTSALECCCFINNEDFLSGSDDGSIELWSILRRKPAFIVKNAHSISVPDNQLPANVADGLSNGTEAGNASSLAGTCSSAQTWVSSVAVCKGSDLAASGAGNGVVRLWTVESDARSIKPLHDLPLVGFVNSLAFARSGRFLLAGVGQEPRLGRWGRIPAARNGVAMFDLRLAEDTDTQALNFIGQE